ncbi:MAG TPA: tetratricopeptide repeat protein [Alphaproteobacteria bacterium]|nr:tetratricopeptide repeat protein [Alphaproteobacteria bacterium]
MTTALRLVVVLAIMFALGPPVPAFAFGSSNDSSTSASSPGAEAFAKAEKKIKAEKYKDAIPLLEKALKADPKNANALNYLGYSHRKLGHTDQALEYYQQALVIEPKHRGANEYLGELYLELKLLDKAEERLSVLSTACNACEEYVELKEKVEAYKKGQSS